ncbi:hypothetical protein [Novosphingobium album (ex Hu et al. 2023)]|uniref:Glycosyltransferase RgtA/B/C/D-like domain-containing protein n=1 Tax=Novosphingobium album (ex Hu et al. 2023) TaxID=2930093 RepID=A0ABT0B311_9SPHN|nr:hypothetical protein [Novosphingobium album (ex Hu et al. 2023)]MCJ2179422.1 hypothetical protein [Novosphingobium album (ex Hu et al. 2023)]
MRMALAGYSLWFDDYASLIFADQPQSRLWSLWMARESNPPLFYSVLHIWRGLGADSVVTLRLLPIIAGIAHVAVVAGICGRWHSRRAAVIVTLLLALSMQHLLVTHMVRGYAFAMLGASISFAGLLSWWDGGRGRLPGMGLFVLGALLAFYTHTTLFLWLGIGPAALVLCHWGAFFHDGLRKGREARTRWVLWRDLLTMVALSCLGTSWWIWVLLHRPAEAALNTAWIVDYNLPQIVFKFMQDGQLLAFVSATEVPLLVAGAAMIACMAWLGRHLALVRLCCIIVALCPLVWWGCSFFQPIVTQRTVQWPMTMLAVILACGMAELRPVPVRLAVVAVAAAVLALNLASHRRELVIEDWDAAMTRAAARPSSALLVQHQAMSLVAAEACALRFKGPCPFTIVALRSGLPSDYWTRGLPGAPLLDDAQARRKLGGFAHVYAVRHGDYDPLLALDYAGRSPRIAWNKPFVEGPFPGASFVTAPEPNAR